MIKKAEYKLCASRLDDDRTEDQKRYSENLRKKLFKRKVLDEVFENFPIEEVKRKETDPPYILKYFHMEFVILHPSQVKFIFKALDILQMTISTRSEEYAKKLIQQIKDEIIDK